MPEHFNLALTVHELEAGEFYWSLLEPMESGHEESLQFKPMISADSPQDSYNNALVVGVAELRRVIARRIDGPQAAGA